MNLRVLVFIVVIVGVAVWLLGDGIEAIQEENTQPDKLGNTLDAARGAAKTLNH